MVNLLSMSALISLMTSLFTLGCCFYLGLHKKSSKRYIMYTLTSDILLSLSYMGRFADWGGPPKPGFWCQWSGFGLVIGANSLTLWIFATATYLVLIFFRGKKPGGKFEACFLILWPLVTILPAALPYAFTKSGPVYGPAPTGQCWLSSPDLIVYLVVFWVGILLLYILLTYAAMAIYVYYVSMKVKQAVNDDERVKKVVTLAVSPIIYLLLYIWIIIARLVQLATGVTPLNFLRFAIVVTVWIGAVNSIWFGYSRNIFVLTYQKYCGEDKSNSGSGKSQTKKTGTGTSNY